MKREEGSKNQRPISKLDATRSFVFALNHRFCLNSASDWSVIFNLSRLKIPSAFPPKNLKSLLKEFCLKQFYTF